MTIGCILLIATLFIITLAISIYLGIEEEHWVPGFVVFSMGSLLSGLIFTVVWSGNTVYHRDHTAPSKFVTIDESFYMIDDQGYKKAIHLRNYKTGGIINTIFVSNNKELELFNNRNFLIQELYAKDMMGDDVFLGYRMIEKTKVESK